jgi:hypothetical protein
MNTRRAELALIWNGQAVKTQMDGYKMDCTYTDPASGEADSLDINIHDNARQWVTAWLPLLGDTLQATIQLENWAQEGDTKKLDCGFFILDNFSFSGFPVVGEISGVSVPADSSFRETTRTKTWENVTIREIAKEAASRAGISLVWDVKTADFTIKSVEQTDETDCDFVMSICETYGFCMKIYARKMVIFDREEYKKKDPVAKISEGDILSWSWQKNLAGTYTGGEYAYSDPVTDEDITASIGSGSRILKESGKADSAADALRKITAAVNNANHGSTTLSISMVGNAGIVASQCVTVVGLGKLSGKYYVDSVTHNLGGGYTMDLELSLVEEMTTAVIEDACARLAVVGVMNSPAYWAGKVDSVEYLDGLILNMATRIKANAGGSTITNVTAALEVLTKSGVINTPDYWQAHYTAVPYLDTLLINAANALTQD